MTDPAESPTPTTEVEANENFEDWYSKAFTGTEVSTFNPLEVIHSPDGGVSGFTPAETVASPVGDIKHDGTAETKVFGNAAGDTDMALVEVRIM